MLSYTRRWLEQVNRGGLFPLNDSTFTFFAAVEKQVRSRLPKHAIKPSSKEKFKTAVIDGVVQDEDVQFYWALVSQDIDNPQDVEVLLTEIVKLWVTVRGFSLAAAWMEEYKKNVRLLKNLLVYVNLLVEVHHNFNKFFFYHVQDQ